MCGAVVRAFLDACCAAGVFWTGLPDPKLLKDDDDPPPGPPPAHPERLCPERRPSPAEAVIWASLADVDPGPETRPRS